MSEPNCERDEITPAMIGAGEDAILGEVGGARDLGGLFSASDLARRVYSAMRAAMPASNSYAEWAAIARHQLKPGRR